MDGRFATPLWRTLARARSRRLAAGDPGAVQRRLLLDLVRTDAGTLFGRDRDFASIRDESDFFARVPALGPAAFAPYLDAVLDGAPDVLHRGRPACFGVTSGTGGGAKLVPLYSRLLAHARRSSLDAALLGCAAGTAPTAFGRVLFIGPRQGRPHGRWTVYPEGTAFSYLHLPGRLLLPRYRDLPAAGESQDVDRLVGLLRRHPVETLAGSPLEIASFARAAGTCFPGVRRVFNCGWWAEDLAPDYATGFPNATVVDAYGTSEGSYGLPHGNGTYLLNHRRVFFSFVPHEDAPRGEPRRDARQISVGEVEPGKKYLLCATVPGGWWNLATGDLVSFESVSPPVVRLHGRAYRTLPLGEDLLTEDAVVAAVRGSGVRAQRYCVVPAGRGAEAAAGFALVIDGEDPEPAAIDRRLCEASRAYRALRAAGSVHRLAVRRTPLPEATGKPARVMAAAPDAPAQARETTFTQSGGGT